MKRFLMNLFASNSELDADIDEFKTAADHPSRRAKRLPQKMNIKGKNARCGPEGRIAQKLIDCNRQAGTMDAVELRNWARMLCREDELREFHFHSDFERVHQLCRMLDELQESFPAPNNTVRTPEKNKEPTITPQSVNNNNAPTTTNTTSSSSNTDLDDLDSSYNMDEIREQHSHPIFHVGKQVRIRLMLAEAPVIGCTRNQSIRKLLSPMKVTLAQGEQPYILSTALAIGPWYLEWDPNTSLCIPRRLASGAAKLATSSWQIRYVDLDFALNKIIPVIIDWNTNKVFNNETANGQHFVDELAKALEFPEPLDTSTSILGDFLSIIREKGYYNMSIQMTEEMRVICGLDESFHYFTTHEQLDAVFYSILEKEPMFPEDYPIEGYMFQMMDRIFWQRHFKDPSDPRFHPIDHKGGCPFKDPSLSVTIRRRYFS